MPLAVFNYREYRNRHITDVGFWPINFTDVVYQSPDASPVNLTDTQKIAAVDLALKYFVEDSMVSSANVAKTIHSSFIKNIKRRKHAKRLTDALLEGLRLSQELSHDAFHFSIVFDLDNIKKIRWGPEWTSIRDAFVWRCPDYLRDDANVQRTFEAFRDVLAKSLVNFVNSTAKHCAWSDDVNLQGYHIAMGPESAGQGQSLLEGSDSSDSEDDDDTPPPAGPLSSSGAAPGTSRSTRTGKGTARAPSATSGTTSGGASTTTSRRPASTTTTSPSTESSVSTTSPSTESSVSMMSPSTESSVSTTTTMTRTTTGRLASAMARLHLTSSCASPMTPDDEDKYDVADLPVSGEDTDAYFEARGNVMPYRGHSSTTGSRTSQTRAPSSSSQASLPPSPSQTRWYPSGQSSRR
ncbi:hypothetical protein ACEPAG_9411 [Sanghuangporus baumii]